jgi:protein O-GlcNAc transferase
MDVLSYYFAFGRYALVQIAMDGHGDTTGIPTVDYFVTYEGYAEIDVSEKYSEQPLVLPGLSPLTLWQGIKPAIPKTQTTFTMSESAKQAFRARFNFPLKAHLYICLQTYYKIHPKMDEAFLRILQLDPLSIIVLKQDRRNGMQQATLFSRLRKHLVIRACFRTCTYVCIQTGLARKPCVSSARTQ